VTLDLEYLGSVDSPFGDTRAGFSASTEISRKDWGLGWNVALEGGGFVVGDGPAEARLLGKSKVRYCTAIKRNDADGPCQGILAGVPFVDEVFRQLDCPHT